MTIKPLLPIIQRALDHAERSAIVEPKGRFTYRDLLTASANVAARSIETVVTILFIGGPRSEYHVGEVLMFTNRQEFATPAYGHPLGSPVRAERQVTGCSETRIAPVRVRRPTASAA